MSAFKEISKIAGAFVGVIVGAGFASGQRSCNSSPASASTA